MAAIARPPGLLYRPWAKSTSGSDQGISPTRSSVIQMRVFKCALYFLYVANRVPCRNKMLPDAVRTTMYNAAYTVIVKVIKAYRYVPNNLLLHVVLTMLYVRTVVHARSS